MLFLQMAPQFGDFGARGVAHGHAHQRGLERAARLEDLPCFLGRGHGHDGAAVRPQLHDVVVREPLQHLAHQRAAHAEQIAQRCLRQLGAGREALVGHAFEDRAVDAFLDVAVVVVLRRGTVGGRQLAPGGARRDGGLGWRG
jgi:hypothetical protein